ncbi:hypothetical protein NDU88_003850 [Pleurodeles waltl]|uniref:Uncharacterized protein n=1 Tax=Pleurodeles waltl TaxID=8319 RepID=A0AAV7MTP3_PLEWA|nr:hypothetical protein NDU88_003850 [Pleurodeles waltl]
MSHSNNATKCDAKDRYGVEAHADALFPRKKRKHGSPVDRIASAASRERDARCTASADQCGPGGKTIEDKSPERQREVERLSGSTEEGGPRDEPWTPCVEER